MKKRMDLSLDLSNSGCIHKCIADDRFWEIQPWYIPVFCFALVPATFLSTLNLHSNSLFPNWYMISFFLWWLPMDAQNIDDTEYLMEDMTILPDIMTLDVRVIANEHAFGASLFHVLRLCSGIKKLTLDLSPPSLEVIVIPLIYIIFICISWFTKSWSASAHRCWLHAYDLCCRVSLVTICLHFALYWVLNE